MELQFRDPTIHFIESILLQELLGIFNKSNCIGGPRLYKMGMTLPSKMFVNLRS